MGTGVIGEESEGVQGGGRGDLELHSPVKLTFSQPLRKNFDDSCNLLLVFNVFIFV